ncbi:murein tripeptide/oligopeptide ABC transporter permease OppC, partial [Lactococcus lactis]|nr:murein tripeptide/oligopeptide ABC transporter permease OppC [Lactococcus lactis]
MTEKKHKNSLSLVHSIKEELKKDKLAMISTIFLVAVFLIVYIYSMFLKQSNYVDVNIMDQYLAPLTNGHLLGTDNGGRDIIMMLMISARNS